MPRPQKKRYVCCMPRNNMFMPSGNPQGEIILTVDEYETIRLIDLEGNTQEQCSQQMCIARTTVQGIYNNARHKIADALVNGRKLKISGGDYVVCSHYVSQCGRGCHSRCQRRQFNQNNLEGKYMIIAVTYENGQIFQHFGHTEQFKLYQVKEGKIVQSKIVDTMGSGHGALAGFLFNNHVDVLICGGIGGGAQQALSEAGIKLFGGVEGSADEAVESYLAGNLGYDPDVHCDHHDHEHQDGNHTCGEHGCGHCGH